MKERRTKTIRFKIKNPPLERIHNHMDKETRIAFAGVDKRLETMATKNYIRMIMDGQEKMMVILKRLDEERIFMYD